MAYTASSIAATANPALDYMTALDALLVAGGFTYIEQWTSATYTARIYKSTAAANGVADWYLAVRRSSDAATAVTFTVFEQWDATNKKLIYYPQNTASAVPVDSQFRNTDTVGVLPNSGTPWSIIVSVGTAGFQHWASVTPSRVYFATRVGGTDIGVGAGLYDDLLPSAISPVPLFVTGLNNGSGAPNNINSRNGGSTREPGQLLSAVGNFQILVMGTPLYGYPFGFSGSSPNRYLNNRTTVRIPIWTVRSATNAGVSATWGLRGLLKDAVNVSGITPVAGDTLTVTQADGSTKTYVCFGGGSNPYFIDNSV